MTRPTLREVLIFAEDSIVDDSVSSLLTNLVAYWKMNEASGTRVDSVGSNDLTPVNTPASAAGKVGNGAVFVGASAQELTHADNADLRIGGVSFTWSLWVKLSALGNNGFVIKVDEDLSIVEYAIGYNGSNDRFAFLIDDSSNTATASALSPSPAIVETWYHLLCQYDFDANEVSISINNGAPATGLLGAGVSTAGAGPLAIGQATWSFDYANATIDEVGFWKRLLTTDERDALYNAGAGTTYPFS